MVPLKRLFATIAEISRSQTHRRAMTRHKKSKSMHLTIRTLRPGWHDKDEVMLHAAFQLFVDLATKRGLAGESLRTVEMGPDMLDCDCAVQGSVC
jgi:hypothetical protein